MSAAAWLPMLAKALATALVVIAAALAAQAFGPFWGAIIASLPVSAGPAYVFLSLEQGPAFVAASALASAAANAASGLFLIVYALVAGRWPPWRSLGAAVAAWLAATQAIGAVAWSPALVVLLNLAVYLPAMWLLDARAAAATRPAPPARRRWFDLPLRAAAIAAFVVLLVAASARLGPWATGIAAVFPVSFISLFVLLRPRIGGPAAAALAASALRPMLGFCLLPLVLHLTAERWGTGPALALALPAPVLWSAGLVLLRARAAGATR